MENKNYITYDEEVFDILGIKVKAVTELFSDEYLNSENFQSRCLRCCFYSDKKIDIFNLKEKKACYFIKCDWYSTNNKQMHFELLK